MSGFFTLPASQKKRKRPEGSAPRPARKQLAPTNRPTKKRREARDDSISGSDSDDGRLNDEPMVGDDESSSEEEDEDAAGRRTKLAERYLENTRNEILAEGFDAKDIDNEILAARMGERLKEDTAESKGKLYRWIADDYEFANAKHSALKSGMKGAPSGIAVSYPYVYSATRDMELIKWEIPNSTTTEVSEKSADPIVRSSKPKLVKMSYGKRARHRDPKYEHHTRAILCIAASDDGKFVATGGQDHKLIIWDATTLKPLKVFYQHRGSVTSLCFRRGSNQLFSASKDRTIKIWSLNELAYVETLYGHQDEVLDVGALNQEKCVTVGARDRTARYWRVVEESQLVFRGGGGASTGSKKRKDDENNGAVPQKGYQEGSMDRVAMVDEETFVTGSDNGSLSLWNIQKKKAVYVYPLAHGLQPAQKPEEASAEADPKPEAIPEPQPRWVTALACLPYSNIFVSGSWDGSVRAWKISEDKRRIEPLGLVGQVDGPTPTLALTNGTNGANGIHEEQDVINQELARGVINDIAIFEKGEKGKDGLGIAIITGKEHRLGRWLNVEGRNAGMVFDLPKQN